jgi:hypothetical protein
MPLLGYRWILCGLTLASGLFSAVCASHAATLSISNHTRSIIKGWGVYPDHANGSNPDENTFDRPAIRQAVYDSGATFIRMELSGGYYRAGTAVNAITFNTESSFSPGSWPQDRFDNLINQLKAARDQGILDYILSSWSPPDAMKTWGTPANTQPAPSGSVIRRGHITVNGVGTRTCLRQDSEQAFCNWYVAAIKYIVAQGLAAPVAISIQNEPTMWNIGYQGCYWDAVQWRRVAVLMRATLNANGLNAVVIQGHDDTYKATPSSEYQASPPPKGYFEAGFPVFNALSPAYDAALASAIGAYAFHTYDTNDQWATANGIASYPKDVWMTEWNDHNGAEPGDGGGTADIDYAIKTARHLACDFVTLPVNYWCYFNAWSRARPDVGGGDLLGGDTQPVYSKKYLVLRRLWNTVRPGWKARLVSVSGDNDLLTKTDLYGQFKENLVSTIAFENPEATSSVLLVANPTTAAKTGLVVTGLKGTRAVVYATTAGSDMGILATGIVTGGSLTLPALPARSVVLVHTATNAVNLLLNGDFGNSNTSTRKPANWKQWSSNGTEAAAYTEIANDSVGDLVLTHYSSTTYNVLTSQLVTSLPSGNYTVTARVRGSSGQPTCQLQARYFGGTTQTLPLQTGYNWTTVTIPSINVTNGQCDIGLYSWAYGEQWVQIDDLRFFKN